MRTSISRCRIALVLLAACSSHPGTPRAPLPPVVAVVPPDAGVLDVGAAPAPDEPDPSDVTKVCVKGTWPYPGAGGVAPEGGEGGEGEGASELGGDLGHTAEEKTLEAWRGHPNEGVCDVRNRETLETSLAARAPATATTVGVRAWDHQRAPAFRDLVRTTLAMTAAEDAQLARDGFVVPARLAYTDYTTAYYDIHRGQLPVYVSADSILHAVYASHDELLERLETTELAVRLDRVLGAMHCNLAAHAADYPKQIARDVDVYLTVARRLLSGQDDLRAELGAETDAIAAPLVEAIRDASAAPTIVLFGRERVLDTTAFTPRGHYTHADTLVAYFRAAMWTSRIEFNLVSRDTRSSQPGYLPDPRETPEEALVALALADLAERSGALADLAALDRAWTAFAGKREDISFAQLLDLRKTAKIATLAEPDAPARLRAAIGVGFQRTVNVFPNPNVAHLPAIATLLGPRITPDAAAVAALVGGRGDKHRPVEVGFMLGHDRAKQYASSIEPGLGAAMTGARALLARSVGTSTDLYATWLAAIRGLAVRPAGAVPGFMDTPQFADLRLNSALAAYGQLRHNHVLLEAQNYDQGGCEIPDGYVEPVPATYRALVDYAIRGREVFTALDPKDTSGGAAYFTRLERLMRVLASLASEELANRPLSADAKRFLAMIVEMRVATAHTYFASYPIATFDGWYLDLFSSRTAALHDAAFVADYATFDREGVAGVHYLGAKAPRLGVFVVDTGGPPRVMVGPVAHAMTFTGPQERRLTDDEAAGLAGNEPWASSYTVAHAAEPSLTIEYRRVLAQPRNGMKEEADAVAKAVPVGVVRIDAAKPQGRVVVELLDHHFVKLGEVAATVGVGRTDLKVPAFKVPIEALRVRVGDFRARVDVSLEGHALRKFGPDAIR